MKSLPTVWLMIVLCLGTVTVAAAQQIPRRAAAASGRFHTATALLSFAAVSPASAEMTVQGWLDFYNGKSSTVPVRVARVMAATYVLGMGDGLISTQIVSCPAGYVPEGDVIAERVADILTAPDRQPEASVTAAVVSALAIDGCTEGPRAKDSDR